MFVVLLVIPTAVATPNERSSGAARSEDSPPLRGDCLLKTRCLTLVGAKTVSGEGYTLQCSSCTDVESSSLLFDVAGDLEMPLPSQRG